MKSTLVFILLFSVVHNSRILFFSFYPSISHQKVFGSIWKQLSLKGHEVVAIATDPLNDQNLVNLTEIDTSIAYRMFETFDYSNLSPEEMSIFQIYDIYDGSADYAIDFQIKTRGFQELLKKPSDYFDLLIVEVHNPVAFGIQHKFKAPMILISSLGCPTNFITFFGSAIHPVLYPDFLTGMIREHVDFTFISKLKSTYATVGLWFKYNLEIFPQADEQARKYFGNDMPKTKDILRNASLLLCNSNAVFSDRRATPPNVIEFSNVHMENRESLPDDLQDILDNAKTGVVYFSLGTNVRFSHVQGNVKETILQALGQLPYTVLCKWESDDFPGKPKNVVLRKWFPQQSILAHPNIKVFVTQGGLQSSEEAIMNGVPLVVIPFLGDQPMNAKILTSRGMAETILPNSLNKDILADTIMKVAKDEKYRTRALELRSIFLDQPQTGLEKIVWWCEYVIRHKGAKHLRSPGADIPLYEYFMLDILAVVLVALFITYKVVTIVLRRIGKLLFRNTPKTELKKKKKN